eukprot:NODE_165_length_16345_cov_0.329743.p8 type:complete len:114 gc:universal NODE_165_length_16345_cov_0.329743:10552-10893(+)
MANLPFPLTCIIRALFLLIKAQPSSPREYRTKPLPLLLIYNLLIVVNFNCCTVLVIPYPNKFTNLPNLLGLLKSSTISFTQSPLFVYSILSKRYSFPENPSNSILLCILGPGT